ncbi:major head protein [Delftia phage RG-2014]|uniref:Major capsid protein n=1 Tax=Delftia phage RG-2014 TaxID=1563661 RepID=A0A097PAR7_9CAUD|nr:major head protein [Delftia phage RG-2014]AIU44328.1 major capsid protein [Delftia phage RG-2014]
MALNYNAPIDGQKSSIDKGGNADQMRSYFWLRKSIRHAVKDQVFMPLADVTNMPMHFGKTIKVYEYLPVLHDSNINDQGIDANGVSTVNGNLYGSSRDVGTITGKLPHLSENGGRVNRIGFTRLEREGTIFNFGLFYEFTRDSLNFDSDDQLREILARETINACNQLTEATLQRDLLLGATTILYCGAATQDSEVTAEETTAGSITIPASTLTFDDFERMDQILTDNRTPTHVTIITGSTKIDTNTVGATRIMYCSNDLLPHIKRMRDNFGDPAFIPVHKYGAATALMKNEVGAVGMFRIIRVQEMLHFAHAGAEVTANPGFRSSVDPADGKEKYDVYPLMVVGAESFTTIGFQTDGSTLKFEVNTKMPGKETMDRNDPYGKVGFSSVQWWYGILFLRPERIGIIKTVAPR